MAKVISFPTGETTNEEELDESNLDVNNPLDFTKLFKIRLKKHPDAVKPKDQFIIWQQLARQTKLLWRLPRSFQWFWFSRELDYIDTEYIEC